VGFQADYDDIELQKYSYDVISVVSSSLRYQKNVQNFFHWLCQCNKPGVDEGNNPEIIWLHSSNNVEILLVMLLSPQLLHDTNSIFCHQVQFFYFSTT